MHNQLFANSPARDAAQLTTQASLLGLDTKKFEACLNSGNGGTHAAEMRESVARMQQLGVDGTPPGADRPHARSRQPPLKVIELVYGAMPYARLQDHHRRRAGAGALRASIPNPPIGNP